MTAIATKMSTLTISEETYQILVNFSTINSSIVFKKGNLIRTIANAENILGEYISEEYILRILLSMISLSLFLQSVFVLEMETIQCYILIMMIT